ncbi:MAG: hypothetical protein ACTSWN_08480 [Promethearchaeota archaeon]
MSEDLMVHVIITGSRQAGISSFISRTAEDYEAYDEEGVGIDIQPTQIELDDGTKCTIVFYEVAGTFPLNSLRKIFRKNLVGFAVMFDLSNTVSLELAETLFNQFSERLGDNMPKVKFLLGSHSDLEKEVDQKYIDSLLTIMGDNTYYYEFSAKTGENITETMKNIVEKIIKK